MPERFNRSDLRFISICFAIMLLCGLEAWRDFGRAFPEASIEFEITRKDSRQIASAVLASRDHDVTGFKHTSIFSYDNQAKVFLERELGAEAAGAVYDDPVGLWRWSHRWFRPHSKEEFRVELTVAGRLARFAHLLPEAASGAVLSVEEARTRAESLLVEISTPPLAAFEFVDGSSRQRPNRMDHSFTWKRRSFQAGESTLRVRVDLAGGELSAYEEFLQVPDTWRHDYRKLRARNQTTGLVASVLLGLTGLAMMVVLVLRIRDRDVRWGTAAAFGLVAFVLQFLTALNGFDLEKFFYATEDSYASFVIWYFLSSILVALASAGGIFLLTAAAEPVYRRSFRDKLSLTAVFSWRGIRTKSFFKQALLGFALTFFFPAFQAVFYLVAARFGAWAPLDVPYSNLLNTAFPWAVVLLAGFSPAVSEEFVSRMFSIPFLQGLLGKRLGLRPALAVALVGSAFIWGFAHAGYPNQPFYIRGLEVGIAGILVGFVMLRWGILATLVWHYSVDAFYSAFLLVRSGNSYFVFSGWIAAGILLIPLLISLVSYALRGGFEPEDGLRNADEPEPPKPEISRPVAEAALVAAYERQSARSSWIVAGVAVGLLFLYVRPVTEPGDGMTFETGRSDAIEAARSHLQHFGANPQRFKSAAAVVDRFDATAGAYVLERTGLQRLNDLYTRELQASAWRVRFFRPEEQEQYTFYLSTGLSQNADAPSVPLSGFRHVLPDSSAGESLSHTEAEQRALLFVEQQGIDPKRLELKESEQENRPRRIDHSFVWELSDSTLAPGAVRYEVLVSGGAVSRFRPHFHVPEDWLRKHQEEPFWSHVVWLVSRGLVGTTMLAVLLLFLAQVRSRRYPWRVGLRWGAAIGTLGVLVLALRWDANLALRYSTATPYTLYAITVGVSAVMQWVFFGLVTAVLVGLLWVIRPRVRLLVSGPHPSVYVRDALLSSLIAVALLVGLDRLRALFIDSGSAHARVSHLPAIVEAASSLQWLDAYLVLLREGILALGVLAIVSHLGKYVFGMGRSILFVAAVVLLFSVEGSRTWGQFTLGTVINAIQFGAALLLVAVLLRGNELAYVITFLLVRGGPKIVDWISQPSTDLQTSGWILAVLVVATLLSVVMAAARNIRPPEGEQTRNASVSNLS